VGDDLWKMLGAGTGFGRKIETALGEHPLDGSLFEQEITKAVSRVEGTIRRSECVTADDQIDWPCLLDKFPDV